MAHKGAYRLSIGFTLIESLVGYFMCFNSVIFLFIEDSIIQLYPKGIYSM